MDTIFTAENLYFLTLTGSTEDGGFHPSPWQWPLSCRVPRRFSCEST